MSAPILLEEGKMQSDLDANFFKIINLDTSNLPPSGIPPTIHPNPSFWLHDWDSTLQQWTATRPKFSDIQGSLTFEQQQAIFYLGTIQTGTWHAFPIEPAYLPTLDLIQSPLDNVSIAGFRITNLGDPINATDAVNKQFMDFLLQGLNPKEAVRCASTTNLTPDSLARPVDGVTLQEGDRVLVKNQSVPRVYQNGIYIAHTGAWTRATDADHGSGDAGFNSQNSIDQGAYCVVLEGTVNTNTSWFQKDSVVHINTDDVEFVIFSTPSTVIAGQGLTLTGSTLSVNYTAHRTVGTGDAIDIASDYVGQSSITTLGTIGTGIWQGTTIASDFGGTGVNNNGFTLTLEGNLAVNLGLGATSASLTLTVAQGATNVILPLSGTLSTLSGTEIFSNKRIVPRKTSIISSPIPAINTNVTDVFFITSQAVPITSMSTNLTGAAEDDEQLDIWMHDNGTNRPINWGPSFTDGDTVPFPTTTIATKWLFTRFVYNKALAQWVLMAKQEAI